MGKLIVLEGLDGSGKATQAQRLTETLQKQGVPVKKVSFPNYQSKFAVPIKEYLAGALGTDANAVNPYAASILYTIDRFASFRQEWQEFYEQGGIIIADRYTTSNSVHQCSKLPQKQWQDFVDWLFELEYQKVGIPKPDLVLYLAVDPQVSQNLLTKRYHGEEDKKDIHEKDKAYLSASQQAAQWCADTLHWTTIQCTQQQSMRSIEDIADEIYKQAEALLTREE